MFICTFLYTYNLHIHIHKKEKSTSLSRSRIPQAFSFTSFPELSEKERKNDFLGRMELWCSISVGTAHFHDELWKIV